MITYEKGLFLMLTIKSFQFIESQNKSDFLCGAIDPIEVAKAIAFFASDESSCITGETLFLDGGRHAKMAVWYSAIKIKYLCFIQCIIASLRSRTTCKISITLSSSNPEAAILYRVMIMAHFWFL